MCDIMHSNELQKEGGAGTLSVLALFVPVPLSLSLLNIPGCPLKPDQNTTWLLITSGAN